MMNKKNNLDEMQEQKLLRTESRGVWLAFWLLVLSMAVQFTFRWELNQIIGEIFVLVILSIYIVGDCLKNGIWARTYKTTLKMDLITTILAGIVLFLVMSMRNYIVYHDVTRAISIGAKTGIAAFVTSLAALEITKYFYNKRINNLENKTDYDSCNK